MQADTRWQPLPVSAEGLCSRTEIAGFLAGRFLNREPAVLLRYGDTGGRILARPAAGTEKHAYLQRYLGSAVTSGQIDWLGGKIAESASMADVIGLRSDLLGPALPADLLSSGDHEILPRLAGLYPLRPFEQTSLQPDDARRLGETRKAMEDLCLPEKALLTDAWIHFGLAEIGFFSALLRHAPMVSVCTSLASMATLNRLVAMVPDRLRVFQCPAYPVQEKKWGGDHAFLWDRWLSLAASLRPSYDGEPLLISAGIWTKVLAPAWAERGGIAIDMGSVMDCFGQVPSRPAVLATRYDDPGKVPVELSLEAQMARTERIEDFLSGWGRNT